MAKTRSATEVSKTLPKQREAKKAKLLVPTALDIFPRRYHLQVLLTVTAVVPHVAGTVYDRFGSLSHVTVPSLATRINL